jgi:hypothetical protein
VPRLNKPVKNGGVQPFFSSFPSFLQLHMLDYFSFFIEKEHLIKAPLCLKSTATHRGAFSNAVLLKTTGVN